ncbi:hypothetical protein AB1Y20_018402 [Prymnesium parvum]|uniref:CXXC-type domain-containing protein n=1 Tax=Prymnesium parvum TaxID=97485 RepID=A0AB34JRM5_PRYPA
MTDITGVKRKRAVSCGLCSACTRDDCGRCINCVDKPKFGGQGVRKQSCLHKRCVRPKGGNRDDAEPTRKLCRSPLNEAGNTLLNEAGNTLDQLRRCGKFDVACGSHDVGGEPQLDEDLLFWMAVDGCMALSAPVISCSAPTPKSPPHLKFSVVPALSTPSVAQHTAACHHLYISQPASTCSPEVRAQPVLPISSGSPPANKSSLLPSNKDSLSLSPIQPYCSSLMKGPTLGQRVRTSRCGVCSTCYAHDCGVCKNCLDKPKFGGPGHRKQACTRRACAHVQLNDERSDSSSNDGEGGEPLAAVKAALPMGGLAEKPPPFRQLCTDGRPLLYFPALAAERSLSRPSSIEVS